MFNFLTKNVVVITTLHVVYIDMLRVLYPSICFQYLSNFQPGFYVPELLLLDALPTPSILRNRWLKSILVWGKVPQVDLTKYKQHQVIESGNVPEELWLRFKQHWQEHPLELANGMAPARSWLNRHIVKYVAKNIYKSKFTLQLPEFHHEDWRTDRLNLDTLQRYCGANHIQNAGPSSRYTYLTILLCVSRDQLIEIGQQQIIRISKQMNEHSMLNQFYERELIMGRSYRCLIVPRYIEKQVAMTLLLENPRIEIVVSMYLRGLYHAAHYVRFPRCDLFTEVMDGWDADFSMEMRRMKCIWHWETSVRSQWTQYLRRFVACQPFAEQDYDEESRLRESIQTIIGEWVSNKTRSDTRFSVEDVFKMTIARLKRDYTIRHSQLDFIMTCVKEASLEVNSGKVCSVT